jgi:replicative DNA helicase
LAALGSVLLGGSSVLRELSLPVDAFYKEGNRVIYAAMQRLAARSEPIDVITVQAELSRVDELARAGGPAALALLVERGAIAVHVSRYAGLIAEQAQLRTRR